jgi:hypothetical protein
MPVSSPRNTPRLNWPFLVCDAIGLILDDTFDAFAPTGNKTINSANESRTRFTFGSITDVSVGH